MSSTKRQHDATFNLTLPPSIPIDLLLEILALSDVATIIRFAATTKPVRRAMLDPGFQRHIIARRATADAYKHARMLGVSYAFHFHSLQYSGASSASTCIGQAPSHQSHLPFDSSLLDSFELVACRGGLVILRPRSPAEDSSDIMRVCNTLTGDTSPVPSPDHVDTKYPYALLDVRDAGRSFKLLAVDRTLRTQTFSTDDDGGRWGWGPVVRTRLPPNFTYTTTADPFHGNSSHHHLVVLLGGGGGTTVHWMHTVRHVVALDVSTASATLIKLPPWHKALWWAQRVDTACQLAASADGRLGLVVAENLVISMWTLASSATGLWSRQVVIAKEAIVDRGAWRGCSVRFMGFGDLSGAVILQMGGVGLVHINLGSKEATVLRRGEFERLDVSCFVQLCLHEVDVSSALQAMTRF